MTDSFVRKLEEELAGLDAAGRTRHLRAITPLPGAKAVDEFGREVWNLSGNDYLSLAFDPELKQSFYQQYATPADYPALSSASSRLLTGNPPEAEALEAVLSEAYGGRPAMVFNSG
ncbi:MAG: hypothetical protein PHS41_08470 [Victivallaceae bacterium]|nr:hypothetical protein [Victivallaceae bacterium]